MSSSYFIPHLIQFSIMTEDLSFVPTLGTNSEYVPINGVESGTHTDCILKESLRPLSRYADSPQRIPRESFVLSTSFPDILPPAGIKLLNSADAIFIRGEFIALRVI